MTQRDPLLDDLFHVTRNAPLGLQTPHQLVHRVQLIHHVSRWPSVRSITLNVPFRATHREVARVSVAHNHPPVHFVNELDRDDVSQCEDGVDGRRGEQ